jgi:hypothetical protein
MFELLKHTGTTPIPSFAASEMAGELPQLFLPGFGVEMKRRCYKLLNQIQAEIGIILVALAPGGAISCFGSPLEFPHDWRAQRLPIVW